jgi:hypothetical protein
MSTAYATVIEAQAYFEERLHERAWSTARASDRPKALLQATRIIDTLNFDGCKRSVYELLENNPDATPTQIRAAEAAQALEFPRDTDTEVLVEIKQACYEIAHALLDGVDPDAELENLGIVSQGYASVRTTYNRANISIEHLMNGVPSATAWRLLKPLLRDSDAIKMSRVS